MIGTRNGHRIESAVRGASGVRQLEREVLWHAEVARPKLFKRHVDRSWQMKFHDFRTKFFGKFGLVSVADQTIVAVGFAAALASAGFAGVMMSTDHSHPMFGGIEHLMLFAQPLHGKPPAVIAQGESVPLSADVDYSATGSIKRKDVRLAGNPIVRAPAEPTEPIIKTYVLHEAQAGVAVVEGRGTAYRIQPGNLLPGAGRVLSVEQRDDKWVVVTTQGIIVDNASAAGTP
jgi:hypothetical protein